MVNYTETVNKAEAEYVMGLTKDDFYELFPRPLKSIKGSLEKTVNNNEYHKMVLDYLAFHQRTNYEGMIVEYSPSLNNPDGRLFAKTPMALQRIHGELRYFLTRGLYHDYDMKNAHPSILCWLCAKEGLPTTHQQNYLRNRQQLLADAGAEKQDLLVKLNSDNARFPASKSKALKDLVDEWNEVKTELFVKFSEWFPKTNGKNPISSLINKVMCKEENRLLQAVLPQTENLVLMFDGFMSREALDCESFQNEVTTWEEKQIVSNVVVPVRSEEAKEETKQDDYSSIKLSFEKNHAKIIRESCFVMRDDTTKHITLKTKTDMNTSYEHIRCLKATTGGFVKVPFINEWVKDEAMCCYDRMDCYPDVSKCPDSVFNTWAPFRVELLNGSTCGDEEENRKAVDQFLNHVLILCDRQQEVADIIVQWIAHMFQHPARKSFSPLFISKPGGGKGSLIELLQALLGDEKVLETQKPLLYVFGNHNIMMLPAFLVVLDEVSKREMADVQGQFKGLVTTGVVNINPKGKEPFKIRSYHRFMATSNSEDPMPTDDDDRRNYIIRCSDELVGDVEYHKAFHGMIDDDDALLSIYNYLMDLEGVPTTFDVLSFPKTDYQNILKEASQDYMDLWLKDFIWRHDEHTELDTKGIKAQDVYADWCSFAQANDIKIQYNALQFGKRLSLKKIDGIYVRATKSCNYRCFDIGKLKLKYSNCKIEIDDTDNVVLDVQAATGGDQRRPEGHVDGDVYDNEDDD